MVWDILLHLLNFDIFWIIGLLLDNLLWVFMFLAVVVLLFNGKNVARGFVHVSLAPLLILSLLSFFGWQDFSGDFLLLYYLVDVSALSIAESSKYLSKYLIWVEEIVFFGLLIVYNLALA